MGNKFKPFEKVLVRLIHNQEWQCDFYSHQDSITKHHSTVGYGEIKDDNILPYEGNEHLVGTDLPADEEVRLEEGEYLICFDCIDYFKAEDFCLSPFVSITESDVRTKDGNYWNLFIKYSYFNPSNMEETKNHILCVKNGKIIRYKG